MRQKVKLGEIAKVSAGNSAPQDEKLFKDGKYPFYRTADVGKVHHSRNLTEVKDYLNEEGIKGLKLYRKGTILFPKSGASTFLNHRVIMGQDGYVVSHLATISVNKDIDENFVYYYLTTVDAKDLCAEQGYPSLKSSNIAEVEIPLPPLETQKAIVAKLDQIFAELDQTKIEIQKNLDNTDELWKSALNQVFQGDWEMKKLGEVCDKITDGSHNPPKGVEHSDYIMISSRNIDEGKIIFDDVRYLEKQDFDLEDKRTNVKEGDVLLSIVGTIGKVCIVKNEYGKFTMQRSVAVVKPLKNKLYSYYLSYFLQAPLFQNVINENARGVAQKGIYLNSVKSLQIPVPPLSEQEKIVEHLDQVSKEVKVLKSQYQSQLDNLEELKKSVLDKAFRGELGE